MIQRIIDYLRWVYWGPTKIFLEVPEEHISHWTPIERIPDSMITWKDAVK